MAKPRVYRHDALCPKCGSNWGKKDGHSRGKQQCKCNQRRKHQEDAKHRFTDEQKEQEVKMRAEGMSLSATVRVIGTSMPTVSEWVKKRGIGGRARLTRFLAWRTGGRQDSVRASIVAFDEMWTYLGIRRGERRRDLWIWTAVVEERDGVRWRMYEVGGRDLSAFSRLLDRLPGADRYETDAYPVYEWLPRDRHVIGKGGAVNWNEGLHSKLRSNLNRLARRTKGYTKSVEMLKHLLATVFEECMNQSFKSISTALRIPYFQVAFFSGGFESLATYAPSYKVGGYGKVIQPAATIEMLNHLNGNATPYP